MDRINTLLDKADVLIRLSHGEIALVNEGLSITTTFNSLVTYALEKWPPRDMRSGDIEAMRTLAQIYLMPGTSINRATLDELCAVGGDRLIPLVVVRNLLRCEAIHVKMSFTGPEWIAFTDAYSDVLKWHSPAPSS